MKLGSVEAEGAVIGAMLTRPKVIGEVVAAGLQAEHFGTARFRRLYDDLVDASFGNEPTDAISVVERAGKALADVWPCTKDDQIAALRALATTAQPHDAVVHAKVIRKDSERRLLAELAADITATVAREDPEVLAALVSQRAMQIATSQLLSNEIISYGDLGRRFYQRAQAMQAARAAGIDLGCKFGLKFLDDRYHGLRPTELAILGGEPGSGKSALSFGAAHNFAVRQAQRPPDQRLGALIFCLEMGEEPASQRFAAREGHIDGTRIREGDITKDQLTRIVTNWGRSKDIPLFVNFTSQLRASQLRAIVAEAVRRYNVGLVVIDHVRYFDADRRFDNAADEDEAKGRFLKENIAKDMNVAVMLLAHTTKAIENSDDRRPRLSHLRGGGMLAAHADWVTFTYRPWQHATEDDQLSGRVSPTDMELIWAKSRHGLNEPTRAHCDLSVMHIRDTI